MVQKHSGFKLNRIVALNTNIDVELSFIKSTQDIEYHKELVNGKEISSR